MGLTGVGDLMLTCTGELFTQPTDRACGSGAENRSNVPWRNLATSPKESGLRRRSPGVQMKSVSTCRSRNRSRVLAGGLTPQAGLEQLLRAIRGAKPSSRRVAVSIRADLCFFAAHRAAGAGVCGRRPRSGSCLPKGIKLVFGGGPRRHDGPRGGRGTAAGVIRRRDSRNT